MVWIVTIEDREGKILAELYQAHDKYLLPDGSRSFIHAAAAWCRACCAFTLVETIPDPALLEAKSRAWYQDRRSSPDNLLSPEQEKAIDEKMLKEGLNEAEQWRLVLKTRTAPARCLDCGQSDFLILAERGDWLQSREIQNGPVRINPEKISHASKRRAGRQYDTEWRRIDGGDEAMTRSNSLA